MFKKDFPYLSKHDFVYLDNAATTQKPICVINKEIDYYENFCANTHRSSFTHANKATIEFENTRKYLKEFINASKNEEIIFTKGATESINLIASSYAKEFKTVIISSLEHHSNITVWHMQNRTLGNGLEVVNCNKNLDFDFKHFETILQANPNSFVSITHISNSFGKIHDIKTITEIAHKYNCKVMIDAAQSLAHTKFDVKDLDVDFAVFSSHKSFGPTGVGALYAKYDLLKKIKPYQTGGATIDEVDFEHSTLLSSPYKFEAGTQNIAGVIGFGQALKYINEIGYEKIEYIENSIYSYLYDEISKLPEVILYTNKEQSIGSISFNFKDIIHDDIGILLDKMKIGIRVGHHCTQPIMKKLGLKGTVRVSTAFYNTKEDIDRLITALKKALNMLK